MSQAPSNPSWLDYVTPIVAVITLINGGVVWLVRRIFLQFLDELLEVKLTARHEENTKLMQGIKRDIRDLRNDVEDLKLDHGRSRRWKDREDLHLDPEGGENNGR